jgi:hypothetical protein
MIRKKDIFIISLLLLSLMFLPAVVGAEPSPTSGRQNMIWKGNISNQKDAFIKVIDTPKGWAELWQRAFDQPAPAVDFEKFVVACVFLGHDADWLYSIGFGEPYLRGDVWIIPYDLAKIILELAGPFKAAGQYHMQVYEKMKDVKMILQKDGPSSRRR